MGSIIIISKKLVALLQVRLHEAHNEIMSDPMLTSRCCLTSVQFESAIVGIAAIT